MVRRLNYVAKLNDLLSEVQVPSEIINCNNVHCSQENHVNSLDNFVISVLKSIDLAANDSLFINGGVTKFSFSSEVLPGWSPISKTI